jgi:hypothetical protein
MDSPKEDEPSLHLPVEIWCVVLANIAPDEEWFALITCKLWFELFLQRRQTKETEKWRQAVTAVSGLEWALLHCNRMTTTWIGHAVVSIPRLACAIMYGNLDDRWNKQVCPTAAREGHFDVLKWAHAQGLPFGSWTLWRAVERGHLEISKWLVEKGARLTSELSLLAATNGHLNILQWMGLADFEEKVAVCMRAAKAGHLPILKWALEIEGAVPLKYSIINIDVNIHIRIHDNICKEAAANGHLEILKWAKAEKCPHVSICTNAASKGHLDVLKWARENGCSWNADVCAGAAIGGHLEVLKWARAHGCAWDDRVGIYARRGNNAELLRWALESGCPEGADVVFEWW